MHAVVTDGCSSLYIEAKLWDYGSVVDKASPDVAGSKAEQDVSISSSETDSESPLACRRRGDQGRDTTGQDNSSTGHDSSQVGLSSPQCPSSSSTTLSGGTYQRSLESSSLQTEKTVSVSELEPVASQTVSETYKTGKTCSEDEGRLSSSPTNKHGVRTDQEAAATQQRNVSAMSMAFSLGATAERLSLLYDSGGVLMEKKEGESDGRRFRAKINPASNNQAEEELRKHIK